MLRPVEREEPQRSLLAELTLANTEPVVAPVAESHGEMPLLPRDHPKWARDTLTISQRTKDLVASLRPLLIRVLTFWDHRLRSISIAGRHVHIDPSGSYRAE